MPIKYPTFALKYPTRQVNRIRTWWLLLSLCSAAAPAAAGAAAPASAGAAAPAATGAAAPAAAVAPAPVYFWDMDAAIKAEDLNYEEKALAFTLEGLLNEVGSPPTIMYNAGFLDFDWPGADMYWRTQLETVTQRVAFTNLTSTLCGLIDGIKPVAADRIKGVVQYENALPVGNGYTFPMALTIASQEGLLPVTSAMLTAHPCLAIFPLKRDLRISKMAQMANRTSAWRWAIDTLLPKASKSTVFNIYHWGPKSYMSDPQSNATLGNLDYAVQQRAFVTDLDPDADAALLAEVFSQLNPLFDAFGWAHNEHSWTHDVSIGGGTVFCSFASPNLSFWALLALDPSRKGQAMRLPSGDSGRPLDKSKYYVTFETNEVVGSLRTVY
jgi:hypothetical protein